MTKKTLLLLLFIAQGLPLLASSAQPSTNGTTTANASSSSDDDWALPAWLTNPPPPVITPHPNPTTTTTSTTTIQPVTAITTPQTIAAQLEQNPSDQDNVIAQLSAINPPILPSSSDPDIQKYYEKYGQAFEMLKQIIKNSLASSTLDAAKIGAYTRNEAMKILALFPASSSTQTTSGSSSASGTNQSSTVNQVTDGTLPSDDGQSSGSASDSTVINQAAVVIPPAPPAPVWVNGAFVDPSLISTIEKSNVLLQIEA